MASELRRWLRLLEDASSAERFVRTCADIFSHLKSDNCGTGRNLHTTAEVWFGIEGHADDL